MVSNKLIVLALLLAVLVPLAFLLNPRIHAQRVQTGNRKPVEFVPGELLVRFRPSSATAKSRATTQLSMSSGGRSLRVEVNRFGGSDLVEGLRLARVSSGNTLDAIRALRSRADVVYAEPNFIRHFDAVPNDTFYGSQWPLKNAQQVFSGGISAESAWDTTTGNQNVVVVSSTQALILIIAISKTTSSSTQQKFLLTASTKITMALSTM